MDLGDQCISANRSKEFANVGSLIEPREDTSYYNYLKDFASYSCSNNISLPDVARLNK